MANLACFSASRTKAFRSVWISFLRAITLGSTELHESPTDSDSQPFLFGLTPAARVGYRNLLGDSWSSVEPKVIALRKEIHTERNAFVLEAEKQYKIGHPGSSEPVGS